MRDDKRHNLLDYNEKDENLASGREKGTIIPRSTLKPSPLPKRFYKNVKIEVAAKKAKTEEHENLTAFAVLLDGRNVKTPARRPLIIPSLAVAELIADEFRLQKERMDPALMPITRLANTVIDAIAEDMQPVREDILRYVSCDMVFYRADSPQALVKKQAENWDKVLDWAAETMGAEFNIGGSIMFISQKPEALAAANTYLRQWLQPITARTPFALAALHLITNITGSALLAFMTDAGALPLPQLWALAQVDEDWTAEQWGKDEEAMHKRAARERDFYAAAAVLAALKQA